MTVIAVEQCEPFQQVLKQRGSSEIARERAPPEGGIMWRAYLLMEDLLTFLGAVT